MPEPLKVLFVSAECAPFAKTGGLGDVVGALPAALRRRGIDARVVMPLYAGLPWDRFERLDGVLAVPMWNGPVYGAVRRGHLPTTDVPVYFLEYHHYFDRPGIYGPAGQAYVDNLERFAFLSRGALELTKALGWCPDIVHAHEWHTALAPVYLNSTERGHSLGRAASVYTIHNLAYQGVHDAGALPVTGLPAGSFDPRDFDHFGGLNLVKAALVGSTMLTTVSPTYAREILGGAGGCTLDGTLRDRGESLVGILNGIDVTEWDPQFDPRIEARFSVDEMAGKGICKAALQVEAGLPVRSDVPVIAVVSRLAAQKGIDVFARSLERILDWEVQVVVLGTGDANVERDLARLAADHPSRFTAWLEFDDDRAHRIIAGADFLVMPSRFEPCGLSQLYALRYGTLPVVRATGGLADTVSNYDEVSGAGTGFVLDDLTPHSLADTVGWAVSTWYQRPAHIDALRRRGMGEDHSWARAAGAYHDLYEEARRRREHRLA